MGGKTAMIVAVILIAGAAAVFTDRLFLAVLFREARASYPEVWWPAIRDGETKPAKIWTVSLGFVASASVVLLIASSGPHSLWHALMIAAIAFLAPAAFLLTAFQFVKLDLWVVFAAGLAWFARMLIAGVVAGTML